MHNFKNLLFLAESKTFLDALWEILSSRIAIIVYAIIILVIIISIIIIMLVNELKRQDVLVINNNQTVNMSENDFNDKSSKKSKKKNRKNKNKKGQEMGFPKSGSQIVQSVDKAVEPVDPKEKEEEEKVEADSRFYMLTKIDHEMKRYRKPIYDNEISLEEVCESFRNFSSCQLGLYYDIKDIRRFIAGLAVTHLMILQGMSGSGIAF